MKRSFSRPEETLRRDGPVFVTGVTEKLFSFGLQKQEPKQRIHDYDLRNILVANIREIPSKVEIFFGRGGVQRLPAGGQEQRWTVSSGCNQGGDRVSLTGQH